MDFFISNAWAQGGGEEPSIFMALLPFLILFVVFYFLLVRPQLKRAKEHRQLVSALAKGDEVTTMGGIVGLITEVDDGYVRVEIADNVTVRLQRDAISAVLPKGTLKDL